MLSLLFQGPPVEMADQLRSEGKIYVVVASVVLIFMVLLIYLIRIDRRISRMEKEKSGSE